MAAAVELPREIEERVTRAKAQIRSDSVRRQECLNFWRGDQYVYRTHDNYLVSQGTVVGSKPAHRPRTTRNLIHGLVEAKVSAATGRIPSYEVDPSSSDPEDISAALLSEYIALYGYTKWGILRSAKKVITSALVMDGGYAMPFWDTTIGPYLENGMGIGDVRIRTFTGDEVGWEPGLEFHESGYHVIVQARSIDEVQSMPGFIKIPDAEQQLLPDAATQRPLASPSDARGGASKLVMVTEYLERPCPKWPKGRRVVTANGRVILPAEDYPTIAYGYNGICLHPLSYTVDPDADRDRGMVIHMIDAQRTYNNATNQQISWAQLALNPQIIGPPMANKIKFTDEPGAYYTVVPINGMTPQWRDVPPIPPELSQMKEEAKLDMQLIAGSDDIPDNVEAGSAIQVLIEQSRARWQSFLIDVAGFHSELMTHCLQLVQQYYTEPRLISIRGRTGWMNIQDFRGADLRDQMDVRVYPGSIEPRTRQAVEQRVQWLVQMFPGQVSMEAAMAAIEGGTGEQLIESYELDLARAHLMVQKIISGPDAFLLQPLTDPMQPPPWAPRKDIDNVSVHIHVFADYCKTPDYDNQPIPIQEALRLYLEACVFLKNEAAIQQQMMQAQTAASIGMSNATSPMGSKPMPSLPAPGGTPGGPPAPPAPK